MGIHLRNLDVPPQDNGSTVSSFRRCRLRLTREGGTRATVTTTLLYPPGSLVTCRRSPGRSGAGGLGLGLHRDRCRGPALPESPVLSVSTTPEKGRSLEAGLQGVSCPGHQRPSGKERAPECLDTSRHSWGLEVARASRGPARGKWLQGAGGVDAHPGPAVKVIGISRLTAEIFVCLISARSLKSVTKSESTPAMTSSSCCEACRPPRVTCPAASCLGFHSFFFL